MEWLTLSDVIERDQHFCDPAGSDDASYSGRSARPASPTVSDLMLARSDPPLLGEDDSEQPYWSLQEGKGKERQREQ